LAWLNATLDEKVLSTVYGLTTSTQVWNALATRFAPQSRSRIIHLKRQLQTLQQGNKSCSDHLLTAKHLSGQLSAVAKPVDNEDLISYIVGGLNPIFTTFITSLSFATRDQPISFDAFQAELLNYEQLLEAQNKSQSSEITQVAFFTPKHKPTNKKPRFPTQKNHHHARSNPNPIFSAPDSKPQSTRVPKQFPSCQICGKTNHQALDCYHRMDFSYQGRHPPAQLAAMAAHTQEEQGFEQPWYLDSGANNHITSELQNLTLHQQPYHGNDKVTVGNGGGLHITNTGSSMLATPESQFLLTNILHCPSASSNLLSIQRFCFDNNCYFILTATHFFGKDLQTKEILLQGPSKAGLYPMFLQQLKFNKSSPKAAMLSPFTALLGVTAPFQVWHSRLGHPSDTIISSLVKNSLIPVSGSKKSQTLCESCQVAKSHKLPFLESNNRSSRPLELIHSDVWTSPITSVGGCKFYVLFIDDFSRFTWLFPLKQKSEVFNSFVRFKSLVENQFSSTIKQLLTDNGGEYLSTVFQEYLSQHGILHKLTCPYTSEQNGISERKHRHITNTGLTLLAQSHLPLSYWVDAFFTATYLINRLPTPVLSNKSPYFTLLNKYPDYSLLKTFGCLCFPLLRSYNAHKLAFRSKKCVFLGYSSNHKGYRCLDPQTNRVYISRHVVFDELNFPAQDALITTSNTRPLQHNSPPSSDSTQTGIISNTLSPVSATLPNTLSPVSATLPSFSIPNPSTSDHDYLPPFPATTSPNINTPTDLSISEIHSEPSHFTSPPHINTTPIPDPISPDSNLEPHSVSASPTQQPDLTSTVPHSSQIIT